LEIHPHQEGLQLPRVTAPEYDATFESKRPLPRPSIRHRRGRELHFRARHEGWSFDVADHAGNVSSDGFYREGDSADAGWMPLQGAIEIIGKFRWILRGARFGHRQGSCRTGESAWITSEGCQRGWMRSAALRRLSAPP
jgi:hypothetical protein